MSEIRMQKINENIQKILSDILKSKVSEDIPFLSVNFVNTSRDLKNADIYLGFQSQDIEKSFSKFKKHIPYIKKVFSSQANLKFTPVLNFHIDTKQSQIDKIDKILDKIKKDEN